MSDPNQALWGSYRNSSHPWPACSLRCSDAQRQHEDGLWWPSSYAGFQLAEHFAKGRDLRRPDVGFHLAMLVGMDVDSLDQLQARMRKGRS